MVGTASSNPENASGENPIMRRRRRRRREAKGKGKSAETQLGLPPPFFPLLFQL